MKKLSVLFCIGLLVFGMTACGREENAEPSTEQSSEVQTGEQTPPAESVQEPAEEVTEPTEEAAGGMDISNGWSEEMTAIRQAVVDTLGENYWPDTQMDPETLEAFYGITPDMYDDYMAEMPMISTNVDTLLIIKAKDDKVEAVEEALNAYRDVQVSNTMQYPMNVGKIQASRIQKYGNFVCFVQLGADTNTALESGDEAVIAQCQEQNELALEVIGRIVSQ